MRKQVLISLAVCLLIAGILAGVKYVQILRAIAQAEGAGPPPETVTTLLVEESEWRKSFTAIGSLAPSQGVTLSAELPGKVIRINFQSGENVKRGTVLVEMDSSVEEANLKGAAASAELALRELARAKSLRERGANSEADLENAEARVRQTEAAVESLRATIQQKRIVAPFDGKTGIRMVNVGQYLLPSTAVVPFHSLDPIFVNFSLPQQTVGSISKGQEITLAVDSFPGETFGGTITAINPQVDEVTRNFDVQGTIENPDEKLRPGMFGAVTVLLPVTERVMALPASSINYAPYGDTVYVLENAASGGLQVRQQVVKLGRKVGNQIAVTSGLTPGQQVVTSGTFKLRPGAPVMVDNTLAPRNDPAPKPADT